ncbi:collagen triple helix repeat domain protein [Geomicrobium sp. JCM 19038]|nr:collagen triple helix repeat domain protein [Geomicrobium sp. JCM 19038]
MSNVTVSGDNETFTVTETGSYLISYSLRYTVGLLLSSQITVNGTGVPQSAVEPTVALTEASADVIIPLAAGDTVTLQLFGLVGAAVLQGGQGAGLTIVRLS